MEEAQGTNLKASWEQMSVSEKITVIENVVDIEKKLSSLSFNR